MLLTRSLKLEEERINVLSEELKIKKSLLEDAEANYHRRLNEEVQRCVPDEYKLLSQVVELVTSNNNKSNNLVFSHFDSFFLVINWRTDV